MSMPTSDTVSGDTLPFTMSQLLTPYNPGCHHSQGVLHSPEHFQPYGRRDVITEIFIIVYCFQTTSVVDKLHCCKQNLFIYIIVIIMHLCLCKHIILDLLLGFIGSVIFSCNQNCCSVVVY